MIVASIQPLTPSKIIIAIKHNNTTGVIAILATSSSMFIFLIEIKNQEFRDSFMDYFNSLWKVAKK